MAQVIADIPELEGREAQEFVKRANENLKKRGIIDMAKAINSMKEIIARSKKLGYL